MSEEKALNNETVVSSEVMPETSETETPAPEPTPAPSYSDNLNEIKSNYERKIAEVKTEYENKLKERDNIISQLLSEEKTDAEIAAEETINILDRINERRMRSKF